MTALRALRIVLLLFVAIIAAPGVLNAHEATLGVLEFREVRPGAYVGRWTMAPEIGAARVNLRVPQHCFLQLPEMNCGEKGLVGPITVTVILAIACFFLWQANRRSSVKPESVVLEHNAFEPEAVGV